MLQPRKPGLGLSACLSTVSEGSNGKRKQKTGILSPQLASGLVSQRPPQGWRIFLVLFHQSQPGRQLHREALKLYQRLVLCLILLPLLLSHLQANLWFQLLLNRCHLMRCHLQLDHPVLLCSLCLLLDPSLPQWLLLCLFLRVYRLCLLLLLLQVAMESPACPHLPCNLLDFQYQ